MPNTCYTYFQIVGDFEPDEITRRLGLQPYEVRPRGLHPRLGTPVLTFWHFGRCSEYSPYVEEQMRQTIAPPLDVIDFCHATRTQIDIDLYMGVD